MARPEQRGLILSGEQANALVQITSGRDLSEDVSLTVEEGDRRFTSSNRVMFLQNNRGPGVKNGTLSTVDAVRAQSMSVLTDDGRSASTSKTTSASTMALPRPSTRFRG